MLILLHTVHNYLHLYFVIAFVNTTIVHHCDMTSRKSTWKCLCACACNCPAVNVKKAIRSIKLIMKCTT